jgi:hypothetical protein
VNLKGIIPFVRMAFRGVGPVQEIDFPPPGISTNKPLTASAVRIKQLQVFGLDGSRVKERTD